MQSTPIAGFGAAASRRKLNRTMQAVFNLRPTRRSRGCGKRTVRFWQTLPSSREMLARIRSRLLTGLSEIDHNSADFRDALSKLGQVIDALRSNNEYAASDPEEHEQRIAELEGGSRLLQAVRIRLAAAVTVLIVPLRWLAIKFADNLINALITAAIGALLLLLGIHLSS